jgi:D-3-phosphoglycerate dehydrogenase / 2-oxoglutarate reductase
MMSDKGKVLIAAPVHQVLTDGLQQQGYQCIHMETINQDAAFTAIANCVGVITSTRLQLNKELLDAAPLLQFIGRMGSGMEVIDLPYAAQKGIKCYASPEGNCNAVAEHALGMLLALTKKITLSNNQVKQGLWLRDENRGYELEGKTIGIIGYGHTGAAFARKLAGFDMNILAYDKYNPQNISSPIINCANLTPIFEQADIISFHVPMQADTLNYFDENFLMQMNKGFILINTSRGIVASTKAIIKGLDSGKISGACLDVWSYEPIPRVGTPERQELDAVAAMPNVIFTPHIAGYSYEALFKMSNILLFKIIND